MLKQVHYGPYTFEPWFKGSGYVDKDAKSLKSFRSKEPRSIWQDLAKPDDLGEFDLHICRFCFVYTSSGPQLTQHERVCPFKDFTFGTGSEQRQKMGKLVYEDKDFEVFEVHPDGIHRFALQCLSLLGHLFLETKSICFNLDGFVYYLAFSKRHEMYAGFFSKEVKSWHDYNLACIVIFPPFQKLGLGQALINFSYILSAYENTLGSPEKPLSSHGSAAYARYWKKMLVQELALLHAEGGDSDEREDGSKPLLVTLKDISARTAISPEDLSTVVEDAIEPKVGSSNADPRHLQVRRLV